MHAGKPHAFLAAYGGGHISMILPICQALRERDWKVTLLALTTASAIAEQAGEPYIGYKDLMHLAAPNAQAFGNQLCPDLDDNGPVSREETLAYHGANFAELVEVRLGICMATVGRKCPSSISADKFHAAGSD